MSTWGDENRRHVRDGAPPDWFWWGLVLALAGVVGEAPLQVVGHMAAAAVILLVCLALAVALSITMRRRSFRLPVAGRLLYLLSAIVGGVLVVVLTKHREFGAAGGVYVVTVVLIGVAALLMRRACARRAESADGRYAP
jgi:hypothetical protein